MYSSERERLAGGVIASLTLCVWPSGVFEQIDDLARMLLRVANGPTPLVREVLLEQARAALGADSGQADALVRMVLSQEKYEGVGGCPNPPKAAGAIQASPHQAASLLAAPLSRAVRTIDACVRRPRQTRRSSAAPAPVPALPLQALRQK